MKDIAADQAEGCRSRSSGLMICRPSTEALKFGRMTVDEIDHDVGDLIAMLDPRMPRWAAPERRCWQKQAGHVLPRGCQRSRPESRESASRRWERFEPSARALASEIRPGPCRPGLGAHDDAGGVMLGEGEAAGQHGEVGQLRQLQTFMRNVPDPQGASERCARGKSCGRARGSMSDPYRKLRIQVGYDAGAPRIALAFSR